MRPTVTLKFAVESSFEAQIAQQPQTRAQFRIFNMTAGEAQANLDSVIGIMVIFSLLV